jgi:hypothetical protein
MRSPESSQRVRESVTEEAWSEIRSVRFNNLELARFVH